MKDWVAWHAAYEDPSSSLSTRLQRVRLRLSQAIDQAPAGPVRLVSLCAGQGHDVIGTLPGHPRRDDVCAVLVESDALPADVLLLCGIFGNISGRDIMRTVQAAPALCNVGATVIWTRHRRPPDLTPQIRSWFAGSGFDEVAFDALETSTQTGVGVSRLRRIPAATLPGYPLFTFGTA